MDKKALYFNLFSSCLLCVGFILSLSSCHLWNDIEALRPRLPGLFTGVKPGLYNKELPITASDAPIADVPANNINAAISYINANPGTYTLFIDRDVSTGNQELMSNSGSINLSIIGLGEEQAIQYAGPVNRGLFAIGDFHSNAKANLTLGNNITLKGIDNSTTSLVLVYNGTFTMKEGSKITGHRTESQHGAVLVNDTFIMEGGEISGNISISMDVIGTAGVSVVNDGSWLYDEVKAGLFIMSGGTISGNWSYTFFGSGGVLVNFYTNFEMTGGTISSNRRGPDTPQWADVFLFSSYNLNRTGGTIGIIIDFMTSQPAPEIEMIWVPAGSFQMGSNLFNSNPVHQVTFTNGFYIGKYPVTQAEYLAVMGENPSWHTFANGNPSAAGEWEGKCPVESVSWNSAIIFCNRLSMKKGLSPAYKINGSTDPSDWGAPPRRWDSPRGLWDTIEIVSSSTGYRLPTEAQWEFAARGGDGSPSNFTYSGSNDDNEVAWHSSNSGFITHEVGLKAPNGLGIYDMSGNVREWCWDWFGSYTSEAKTDPTGAASGNRRIERGGGFRGGGTQDHRSTARSMSYPGDRDNDIGFRVVRPQ